jgi:Fe2+ or Zn2+ uptake regulation protein
MEIRDSNPLLNAPLLLNHELGGFAQEKNMANNLGQPTIQEVSNVMCGQCNAVICLGCPVYELDKQARAQHRVQADGLSPDHNHVYIGGVCRACSDITPTARR